MTSSFINRPFDFVSNDKNPLGLIKPHCKNGKVYQLLGYYHSFSGRELYSPTFGTLPKSIFNIAFQSSLDTSESISIEDEQGKRRFLTKTEDRTKLQLEHVGLNPEEIFCFNANAGYVILFTIYREPISIKTKLTNSGKQAIWDYISANTNVPQVMSENLLAKEIAQASDDSFIPDSFWDQKFNAKTFKNLLHKEIVQTKSWTIKEQIAFLDKLEDHSDEPETVFELNSDYKTVGELINIDLFDLQKKIVSQAKRKGGFVDFTYNNITYKIPKLPLMIWATKYSVGKVRDLSAAKTKFNNDTWYTVCPESLKTQEDAPIHSDWWIGAGFPFEVYNLYQDQYKHQIFNKALNEFAMALIGKNTLEDVVFLAGKELPDITGNVVIYPESLDAFNEDDIIILPNGGVEFDLYIKKVCKNGKGAVIVEVGNKVAHLNIVSKEYNNKGFGFRLIMLPNASELLVAAKTATVEADKGRIIPNN
jgi:hypothetical protein